MTSSQHLKGAALLLDLAADADVAAHLAAERDDPRGAEQHIERRDLLHALADHHTAEAELLRQQDAERPRADIPGLTDGPTQRSA